MWGLLSFYFLISTPIVIAHRGASGVMPEHTVEAYDFAIRSGVDFIEPDLVATKEGVLIARHENELSISTDVEKVFPKRKTRKFIEGKWREGWFAEDFTFAEIQSLRAKQTMSFRSSRFDFRFKIPRLEEILDLIDRSERKPGVYIETKHSSYFRSIGLPLEERILEVLDRYGYEKKPEKVYIQSFEVSNLQWLSTRSAYPLIQLIGSPQSRPKDRPEWTYSRMLTDDGLKNISEYAAGIGPYKHLIYELTIWGELNHLTGWSFGDLPFLRKKASSLVDRAHRYGLLVHPWVMRQDHERLPKDYGGDMYKEYTAYWNAFVDGVFTDFPVEGVESLRLHSSQ